MAGDLATMKARIATELARGTGWNPTAIANAISDAIAVYQQERFRFSDIDPVAPPTFNTVAGRSVYDSTDNANIGSALRIDYVNMNIGTASVVELSRDSAERLKLYNQQSGTMVGQPTWYAYEGNKLILASIPDQAYLITLGLFRNVAAPATNAEAGNPWMVDAERLIRARAKYEIAVHVTRNPTMAQAMSPDPPSENGGMTGAAYREWKRLKGTANRITGTGRIRGMRF